MLQNAYVIMERVLIFLVQFYQRQEGWKVWELDDLIDLFISRIYLHIDDT